MDASNSRLCPSAAAISYPICWRSSGWAQGDELGAGWDPLRTSPLRFVSQITTGGTEDPALDVDRVSLDKKATEEQEPSHRPVD